MLAMTAASSDRPIRSRAHGGRPLPIVAAALLAVMAVPRAVRAQSGPEGEPELTREAQLAVERGLAYLARTQVKADEDDPGGYWLADIGYKLNYGYQVTKEEGRHVGVTALACTAFLANGSLPGRGEYGENVERGLEYILGQVKDSGFITDEGSRGTRMYSHAFATLFLAEVYGMTHRQDVKSGLKSAVDGIVKWQNTEGGWRYLPLASDADLSVTVCQLQALRAARNVGIQVNTATIERAIRYVVRCANPDGSFKYQDMTLSRESFALTAAGLTSLYYAGVYEDESTMLQEALEETGRSGNLRRLIAGGLDYLRESRFTVERGSYFYYYGHYYAAQAMFVAGGENWTRWYESIRDELVRTQRHAQGSSEDGSWMNNEVGPVFGTAIASLILQIPYHYLPIFQR